MKWRLEVCLRAFRMCWAVYEHVSITTLWGFTCSLRAKVLRFIEAVSTTAKIITQSYWEFFKKKKTCPRLWGFCPLGEPQASGKQVHWLRAYTKALQVCTESIISKLNIGWMTVKLLLSVGETSIRQCFQWRGRNFLQIWTQRLTNGQSDTHFCF